jgi:hypothetical protein
MRSIGFLYLFILRFPDYLDLKLISVQLASVPLHPDQRVTLLYLPLLCWHLLPESALLLLQRPAPRSLSHIMQLV